MSIATAVILNVVAVIGLLGLLTATMRLPYYMPMRPRTSADGRTESRRRRRTAPAPSRTRRERGAPEPVYSR